MFSKRKCNYVRGEEYYGSRNHQIINGLCEETSCKNFFRLMSQAEYFGSIEICFTYDANRVPCLWLKSKFIMCSCTKIFSNFKHSAFNFIECIDLCALFGAFSSSSEHGFLKVQSLYLFCDICNYLLNKTCRNLVGLKIRFSCCDSTRGQQLCLTHLGGLGAGSVSSKACMVTDRCETAVLGSFDLLSCQSSNRFAVSFVCAHF